jgi:hypothetical protein
MQLAYYSKCYDDGTNAHAIIQESFPSIIRKHVDVFLHIRNTPRIAVQIRLRLRDVYRMTALFLLCLSYSDAKRRVLKAIWS